MTGTEGPVSLPPGRPMYPRWLRAWHWMNAVLFALLIVSGFSLHFAGVGSGGVAFRWAVVIHNVAGVLLLVVYLYYLVAMALTGHWRYFVPKRGLVRGIYLQARFYLFGIFRGEHHPFPANIEGRFNPIQQMVYAGTVFALFPAQSVTGVALLYPDRAPERVAGLSGILPMAVTHSVLAYAFTSFLLVHLYLAVTVSEEKTGLGAMLFGDRPRATKARGAREASRPVVREEPAPRSSA